MPVGPSEKNDWFNNYYLNICYRLEYTGGLLLAKGFIEKLYVHMGFHPAWKYRNVIELIFENGEFEQEFDRSEQMAKFRQQMLKSQKRDGSGKETTDKEIREFIDRAFDRKYKL